MRDPLKWCLMSVLSIQWLITWLVDYDPGGFASLLFVLFQDNHEKETQDLVKYLLGNLKSDRMKTGASFTHAPYCRSNRTDIKARISAGSIQTTP